MEILDVEELEKLQTRNSKKEIEPIKTKFLVLPWLWGKFKLYFGKLFLVGPLVDCDVEDHIDAFKETFFNLIFATMPIWLTAMISYAYVVTGKGVFDSSLFFDLIKNGVSKGELFVFSTSILAPVLFLTWQKGPREFPAKGAVGVTVLIVLLICTSFFSSSKARPEVNNEFILIISTSLAAVALVLRYIGTVYHKYRHLSPDRAAQEKAFTASVERGQS